MGIWRFCGTWREFIGGWGLGWGGIDGQDRGLKNDLAFFWDIMGAFRNGARSMK